MKKFKEYEQHQQMLLPPSLEDLLGENEMVRVVNRVVEEIGHEEVLERFDGGGCPSFHPVMMLKVLVYAYSLGMYSSRQIAKALKRDISFMWLSGMQKPNFRTINRFRGEYFKSTLEWAFSHVVQFLKREGYVLGEDYFIDGTSIEADAGKYSYVWKSCAVRYKDRATGKIKELFKEINRINEEEDRKYGDRDLPEFGEGANITSEKISEVVRQINEDLKRLPREPAIREIRKRKKEIEKLNEKVDKYEKQIRLLDGRNSYSKTDPDASFFYMKNKQLRAGYNLQLGSEKGFVVGFSVHQRCNDASNFVEHLKMQRRLRLPKPKRMMGDSIYGTEENYTELKRRKIENFLKYPRYLADSRGSTEFSHLAFTKLDDMDAYRCPAGRKLRFYETKQEVTKSGFVQTVRNYRCMSCAHCRYKRKCLRRNSSRKSLNISEPLEAFRLEARKNLSSDKGRELRKRRGNECEGVFAELKKNQKFSRFNVRGKVKASAEAALVLMAHNIKKIAVRH